MDVLETRSDPHTSARPRLPNLFVYIDLRDGQPTGPSLFALSEARRASHHAGVTVFAVVMTDPRPPAEMEPLTTRLGIAGADKVLVCEAAGLSAPPLDATHGPALLAVAERVPPLVVLFPAGGPGPELGPPLAARLGGAFGGCSDLDVCEDVQPLPSSTGRLQLRRWRADRSSYRRLDPVEIERPVIAIVGAHGVALDLGTGAVEVEVIACTLASHPVITVLQSDPDDMDALELAYGLIVVASEAEPGVFAKLAAAAPAGVVVVEAQNASQAALAFSTPDFVLQVGRSPVAIGGSPRTRVGLAMIGDSGETQAPGIDVVWHPSGDAAWDGLAAALKELRRP